MQADDGVMDDHVIAEVGISPCRGQWLVLTLRTGPADLMGRMEPDSQIQVKKLLDRAAHRIAGLFRDAGVIPA